MGQSLLILGYILGGGFKYFYFHTYLILFGEMIKFD